MATMSLVTPNKIRTLQRKLDAKAKQEPAFRLALGACLGAKHIGKPCAGKPLARFDERGQATVTTIRRVRHRQTKGAAPDRLGLRTRETCSLLYPELPVGSSR